MAASAPPAAEAELRAAVRLEPCNATARVQLADALIRQCHSRQAGQVLLQAQLESTSSAWDGSDTGEVAWAFKDVVRLVEAVKNYRAALELEPDNPGAHTRLAGALRLQGQLDECIQQFRTAVALDPDSDFARAGLADALLAVGEVEESVQQLQDLVDRRPELDSLHSSLLLALHYRALRTPAELFEEHTRYGDRHACFKSDPSRWSRYNRDPERPLRIGYISPDFRTHSVAYFVEPIVKAHDRSEFRLYCYSNVIRADATTERFKSMADVWRDVNGMTNSQVADLIRSDELDILVDLAGHTLGNKLRALARRAAPIQVSYLGYPNTTGVPAIDYRLTDAWADPDGHTEALHTERLVRLDTGFLCYRPPEYAPAVGPLPAGADGPITFGSFNNLSKLSPEVVATWAELLRCAPGSKLMLKAGALGFAATRAHMLSRFRACGVSDERLHLVTQDASPRDHLERYNQVDIALDTFPYNGTTTTCESLWMGVPVVSLAGPTHVSRVGVSLLSQVGVPDLIARSREDYVEIARGLASDRGRLMAMRSGLREAMARSLLTDAEATTRAIEKAYRQMWRNWVDASGGSHVASADTLIQGSA
jgi:predicted O-linked N-acetylglucosamine transferase (SPINDLY family)